MLPESSILDDMRTSGATGWWFSINPNAEFAARYPNTSWAEALGKDPAAFMSGAVHSKLVGVKGKACDGGQKRLTSGQLLVHNITICENHFGGAGRLSWACVGEVPYHEPVDQLPTFVNDSGGGSVALLVLPRVPMPEHIARRFSFEETGDEQCHGMILGHLYSYIIIPLSEPIVFPSVLSA